MTLLLAAAVLFAYPDSVRVVGRTYDYLAFGSTSGVRPAVRDSRGRLHLVHGMDWQQAGDSVQVYYTCSSDDGLTWAPLANVSRNDPMEATDGALAIGPNDEVACVWFQSDSLWRKFDYWFSQLTDSGWTQPVNVSRAAAPTSYAYQSTIAVDPAGRVHVAYEILLSGLPDIYYTAQSGDTWLTPERVSDSPLDDGFPTMICDTAGRLHLCWRQRGADSGYVMYARRDTAWTPPARIDARPLCVADVCIGSSQDGQVSVVYLGYVNTIHSEVYCTDFVGDTWAQPVQVSDARSRVVFSPTSAADNDGHGFCVWVEQFSQRGYELRMRRRVEGEWSDIVELTHDSVFSAKSPRLVERCQGRGADLLWLHEWTGDEGSFSLDTILYMRLSPPVPGIASDRALTSVGVGESARPNPFTATVELRFAPVRAGSSVDIYSADGALVKRLPAEPGQRSTVWDGTNVGGRRVPVGVYIVRTGDVRVQRALRVIRI